MSKIITNRATVTFHTSPETKKRLDRLATITRRSKSYLTNVAVEKYLAEEEAFVQSIVRGQADMKSGRTYTTNQMRTQLKTFVTKKTSS